MHRPKTRTATQRHVLRALRPPNLLSPFTTEPVPQMLPHDMPARVCSAQTVRGNAIAMLDSGDDVGGEVVGVLWVAVGWVAVVMGSVMRVLKVGSRIGIGDEGLCR